MIDLKFLKSFDPFSKILTENKNVLNKYASFSFSKKIKQDKEYAKFNAINIKEAIHKACEWVGDKSCFIFLFEISIVETSLGCSNKSMATRGTIGRSVWHVDKGTFEDTKKNPSLEIYRKNLKKYGLDWELVEWNDLSLNLLIGAIGAKLVLLMKGLNQNTVSQINSLQKRAKTYSAKYNGGGTSEAEENYIKNCKAWYNYLMSLGAEHLEFNGKKYEITKNGLALNSMLV